jgi:hypothetical protein
MTKKKDERLKPGRGGAQEGRAQTGVSPFLFLRSLFVLTTHGGVAVVYLWWFFGGSRSLVAEEEHR